MTGNMVNEKIKEYPLYLIKSMIIPSSTLVLLLIFVLPFIYNNMDDQIITLIVFSIISIWCLSIVLHRLFKLALILRYKKNTPIYKAIIEHGQFEDVSNQINYEINNEVELKIKDIIITKKWILSESLQEIEKYSDLVWMYEKITEYKDNFGSVNDRFFHLIFVFRNGHSIVMSNQYVANFEDIITKIHNKSPWIVVGFSDKINYIWENNRSRFLKIVDEKKVQTLSNDSKSSISEILD